jgi:hypothetical protein
MTLSQTDLSTITAKGITPDRLQQQLEQLRTGFPYLELTGSATVGHGIIALSAEEQHNALQRWQDYLNNGGEACKFVPASGAASRMFKSLFAFLDGADDVPAAGSDVANVVDHITRFAFYPNLDDTTRTIYNKSVQQLIDEHRFKDLIAAIITEKGLNYGNLPKGLLQFHAYPNEGNSRTPVEEQIAEGIATAVAPGGTLHLHFTVSPAHRSLFEAKLAEAIPTAEARAGVKISVSLSEQKSSTDTVASNPDGTPFRQPDGTLLFRPGGHGALIENLNDINAAVVFIKNIDNVVPDHLRESTIRYKQVLAGYLITVHDRIADYISRIDNGNYDMETIRDMIAFLHNVLNIRHPKMKQLEDADLVLYIRNKLDRPLRVCGMVRNEGEPGGGPFLAVGADGSSAPQILESHQIDQSNAEYVKMLSEATHFNPVDLVCYLRRPDGSSYHLPDYVDHATGFISHKSSHGRELLALELPGLWNGAMSDWNTVFVEVPGSTFNPVKTVNDLLRPSHQPE